MSIWCSRAQGSGMLSRPIGTAAMNRHWLRLLIAVVVVGGCGTTPSAAPVSSMSVESAAPTAAPTVTPTALPAQTPSQSAAGLPRFAPDEPLVLTLRQPDDGGGIFVMRPDGTGLRQLATDILP